MSNRVVEDIQKLRKERNAIILAHNYQIPEVQDIADFTGDSLELSRKAAAADCDVIVFCGVTFMAETAYILSPRKTVLIPDPNAGCPLADMVDIERFRKLKQEHPDAFSICYVNSTAEVKAESDVCCTSANAIKVVQSLNGVKEILFVPDRSLGEYVQHVTGKPMVLARGFCPTHHRILKEHILKQKELHPDALVVVHPECTTEVVNIADHVCSTSQMAKVVRESAAKQFIIGTEEGLLHRLRKDNPGKEFFPPNDVCICPNMKLTTLEKLLWSLETMEHRVVVEENIRVRAQRSLERMLEYV